MDWLEAAWLRGGLIGVLLFVVPGALIILGMTILYAYAAHLDWFAALFLGVKSAVLAIVVQAVLRTAGRPLKSAFMKSLALVAFIGLFFFDVPLPIVVLGVGMIGMPSLLALGQDNGAVPATPRQWAESVRAACLWANIWAVPMALVLAILVPDHVLWKIGSFISQLAVVTFSGTYAVLGYMRRRRFKVTAS